MVPALSELWQSCFGDDAEYIQFFMEHRFRPEDTLVWLEKGCPVGVAYLLPCSIDGQLARYGYAIGVLPAYQGHGIGRLMVNGLLEVCQRESSLFFGTPLRGLEEYYHRLGSIDAFYRRTERLDAGGTAYPLSIAEARPELYTQLRNDTFAGPGFVCWDVDAVAYALAEQRLSGGFAHVLTWESRPYLLLGRCTQDGLSLLETTLSPTLIRTLAPSLCAYYHVSHITCPFPDSPGPESQPHGCCWIKLSPSGWFGLDLS